MNGRVSAHFGPRAVRLFTFAAWTLGWRPDDFWSATPAELLGALGPPSGADQSPLGRAELYMMMEQDDG